MTNAELIKALRHCGKGGDIAERCLPCDYYDREPWCEAALVNDAADALEAAEKRIDGLQKLVDINTERCEALRKQLRESHENYEKHLNELEAQLPKRGAKMDAESEADADYQASVLMQEYFERYEPTYNSEDGSM